MSFHLSAATSHPIKGLRVLAATIGSLAILAVPATQVFAEPIGPTDPGVRCAAKVGPGQYEFYLPGEKATDVNGNKWVCGPDGQWFRDYSAAIKSPTITISPLRTVSYSTYTLAR
jgi:hypothetical protein